MLSNISLLYVEDDLDVADEVAYFLRKKITTLHLAQNGEEGLELFRKFSPDVIVTDIQMPKMNGLEMIKIIHEENPGMPIIITSAFNEPEMLLKAIDVGVDAYMLKPIHLKELLVKIQKSVAPIYLSKELEKSKAELATMKKLQDTEKKLLAYKERMDYAFTGSNDGLWDWDILEDKVYLSPRWKAIIGYKEDEIRSSFSSWKKSVYPEDLILAQEEIQKVFSKEKEFYNLEYRQIHKDGHLVWVLARGIAKFDEMGNPIRMIGTHTDITDNKLKENELKEAKERLEKLSITDELTSLYNRRYFNQTIAKEINRSKRDKKSIVFLMLDVDFFKLYNDNYGHLQGDIVLTQIADVLNTFANREGDYAFRLGGEEFGIIFTSGTIQNIHKHIQKLLQSIEGLNITHAYSNASKFITASIGVAIKRHDDNITVNELYAHADKALYQAKASGRNQIKLYNQP
ncbi:diguanylate cyclase [Sulfurimonas aquatica]|uniref:diguanylate cyclase n=1 Tax=Sulfurimonas aquatica TaxID=2672570 RepID=A0A975AZ58_9BACT|nr:diguanylate cyclase [Sulfurimonas aquatica]QSZ41281.1 diguanylate cyclase [Sulfurimonas aquatica]